ncbi:MAG: M14 family metallopeptidase [Opitutales bacterium]
MKKTVISSKMPIDEVLRIEKNSIETKGATKRISIVTGTHGDELDGQYVCFLISKILKEQPQNLLANVDIYPALNPLGVDSITRGIPNFDLDMNRIFPGDPNSSLAESLAYAIVEDLKGSSVVIDIHSSNIFLREAPQARINVNAVDELLPIAEQLNIEFIWIHDAATVLEATLAHTLNSCGTPTVVVEMGVGMRLVRNYCESLVAGIFNMMKNMGLWKGEIPYLAGDIKTPEISTNGEVEFFNAKASGVFVTSIDHSVYVEAGDEIGKIVDPLSGDILQVVTANYAGFLFTLRVYPIVYEGSLLARLYRKNS